MLSKFSTRYQSFYRDENGLLQGLAEFRHLNGVVATQCFYIDNKMHGEYKYHGLGGDLVDHCFYVNGERISFDELPLPKTEEERMYFKLKYNIPLLPVETVC